MFIRHICLLGKNERHCSLVLEYSSKLPCLRIEQIPHQEITESTNKSPLKPPSTVELIFGQRFGFAIRVYYITSCILGSIAYYNFMNRIMMVYVDHITSH